MIDPLVHHLQRPLRIEVDGDAVLCKYGQAVGGNQLRNAVVDFRVNVVGPARQDHAPAALFFHFPEDPQTLPADVLLGPVLFLPSFVNGFPHLACRDTPLLRCGFDQPVCGGFFRGKGNEGPDVVHISRGHCLHIVLDVFRIGNDNGAVKVVLGIPGLLVFIEHAGVENVFDAVVNEPLHMAVDHFCRVAFGFRRDGFHAQLIEFPVREGRKYNPEAQFLKESGPERVVFVHIEGSGDADDAPGGLFFGERLIVEEPLPLVLHHIGGFFTGGGTAGSPLAAVAADMLAAAGEFIDGQHAVVGASAAAHAGGGIGELQDFIQGEHLRFLSVVMVPGRQGCAEGAHDACNIRADCLHPGDFFKGPKHRQIVEGAALDHDVLSQGFCRGQLDDLEQSIFDNGIRKACGNIRDFRSFLLGLLHIGVHEHRAAGAQVHGSLGKQGFLGKIRSRIAQGGGKVFNKRAAAGGAGFVQKDGVHRAVS